ERHWKQSRWQVWLNDVVDTYEIEETPSGFSVYLVTTRGRHVLGRKVFNVSREDAETPDEALLEILRGFYAVHLPREIRVPVNFYGRRELTERLTDKFGRQAVISVARGRGVNAARGLIEGHDEHELDRARPRASHEWISRELQKMFSLDRAPKRVECFDVAHISGTGFVGASAAWISGRFVSAEYNFVLSGERTELGALADAVLKRIGQSSPPDLIVLDGGKPQLNNVLGIFEKGGRRVPLVAAVKPRGKHSSVAAFLSEDGGSIPFDVNSPAHAVLQLLRDEAHDLANRVHRDYREMMPFYERSGHEQPLVVPLRFHAENGGAEDLVPIPTR
ncbi:MAG: hypothetical protein JO053_09070, partial [Acidobacteria bacterium]|nr:hypothetical protein [Acidobacteriota bacterium]